MAVILQSLELGFPPVFRILGQTESQTGGNILNCHTFARRPAQGMDQETCAQVCHCKDPPPRRHSGAQLGTDANVEKIRFQKEVRKTAGANKHIKCMKLGVVRGILFSSSNALPQ